jgi:hypothetical protein
MLGVQGGKTVTSCSRFEDEALVLLEQGEPLDEHFVLCDDCNAARASYDRLKDALASIGEDREPNSEWKARIQLAINGANATKRSRRAWILSAAAGVAIALGGAVLYMATPDRPSPRVALRQEVVASEGVRLRGETLQPGAVLVLQATTGGARQAEIRVYRDERIVHRIVGAHEGIDKITGRIVLEEIGSFQAILITSNSPIPPPRSSLDEDAGAALNAGASIELADRIDIH